MTMRANSDSATTRTTTSSWAHERWGGFLLTHQSGRLVHARLTGRLGSKTLAELDRRVERAVVPGRTQLLALDAAELQHIPLDVAAELTRREKRWRSLGVVAFWVGLNPYLADLLVLACDFDQILPAVGDLERVSSLMDELEDLPASSVRGWLEAHSVLLH